MGRPPKYTGDILKRHWKKMSAYLSLPLIWNHLSEFINNDQQVPQCWLQVFQDVLDKMKQTRQQLDEKIEKMNADIVKTRMSLQKRKKEYLSVSPKERAELEGKISRLKGLLVSKKDKLDSMGKNKTSIEMQCKKYQQLLRSDDPEDMMATVFEMVNDFDDGSKKMPRRNPHFRSRISYLYKAVKFAVKKELKTNRPSKNKTLGSPVNVYPSGYKPKIGGDKYSVLTAKQMTTEDLIQETFITFISRLSDPTGSKMESVSYINTSVSRIVSDILFKPTKKQKEDALNFSSNISDIQEFEDKMQGPEEDAS